MESLPISSPGEFPRQHSQADTFCGLIDFGSVADIEVGFADHRDDRRISDFQVLSRAGGKGIPFASN
jgi:hypothetical protein